VSAPLRPLPVEHRRSGCPINLWSELLGDHWTLVVLRDLMFTERSGFRELLDGNDEGIASNVLASRLAKLVEAGLLRKDDDPGHRQRVHYRLTEPAIQLLPALVAIGSWAATWLPADPALASTSKELEAGGRAAVEAVMDDLRRHHGVTGD
jgi:DNA-binding HxlR family transcriptional regulator